MHPSPPPIPHFLWQFILRGVRCLAAENPVAAWLCAGHAGAHPLVDSLPVSGQMGLRHDQPAVGTLHLRLQAQVHTGNVALQLEVTTLLKQGCQSRSRIFFPAPKPTVYYLQCKTCYCYGHQR